MMHSFLISLSRTYLSAMVLLGLSVLFGGCSSSNQSQFNPLEKPVDIQHFENTANMYGQDRYIIAVLDEYTKGVALVETKNNKFLDFFENDPVPETLLPIGGHPVALALEEKSATEKRVWVLENQFNRLYAIDIIEGTQPSFEFVDLSSNRAGLSSEAIFENSGRGVSVSLNQTPSVHDFVVDDNSDCQSWQAKYNSGSESYRIESSKTGIQDQRAFEGQMYSSDDGQHSFMIEMGSLNTTHGDRLTWFTCSASYIELPSDVVDIHIINDQAFILLNNSPSIEVLDLNSLTFSASIPIAGAMLLKKGNVSAEQWYLPDTLQNTVYRFDFASQMLEELDVPDKIEAVIELETDLLLLASSSQEEVYVYDSATQMQTGNIIFESLILGFVDYRDSGVNRVLAFSRSGTVDAINLSTLQRVDFSSRSGKESSVLNPKDFFDQGQKSQPELIGLSTQDGATLTQSWQLIYEGVTSGLYDQAGSLSGNVLSVSVDLSETQVQPGDQVSLRQGSTTVTFLVQELIDANSLSLTQTPTLSGAVTYSVSALDQYIVIGSISKEQMARITENEPYLTDNGEFAVLIKSSAVYPTSQGDFFSFRTQDGINPMDEQDLQQRSSIMAGTYFFNAIKNRPESYLVQQSSGRVLSMDLKSNSLIKSIR